MTDFADVQGNILRGYRMPRVRYLILEVADRFALTLGTLHLGPSRAIALHAREIGLCEIGL